jgi:hypothetical protein
MGADCTYWMVRLTGVKKDSGAAINGQLGQSHSGSERNPSISQGISSKKRMRQGFIA